jgi:ribosome-binding protein aMBF1 (putative translation factor)
LAISSKQIKAGRALLDWSAKDLSERAGVSIQTVQKLEWGKTAPGRANAETMERITDALTSAGVVLLDDGVGVTLRPAGRE